jgi:hypothetical protein
MTSVEAMKEIGEIVAAMVESHLQVTEQLRECKDELLQVCMMHEWSEDPARAPEEICYFTFVAGRNPERESPYEFIRRRRKEAIEKGRGL